MRFHFGGIPRLDNFSPVMPAWHEIREPGPLLVQLIGLPIGIATLIGVGRLWFTLTPFDADPFALPIPVLLAILATVAAAHMLVQVLVHPGCGSGPHSFLCVWPRYLLVFAHYTGELTRERSVAILVGPFLFISILPIAIGAMASLTAIPVVFASLINAAMCGAELTYAALVLLQVPARSVVRNRDWKTYWRHISAST